MTERDRHLEALGLDDGCSLKEIRAAWLDLAKVWHPDRFPGDERLQCKATEQLQRINAAYEFLKINPSRGRVSSEAPPRPRPRQSPHRKYGHHDQPPRQPRPQKRPKSPKPQKPSARERRRDRQRAAEAKSAERARQSRAVLESSLTSLVEKAKSASEASRDEFLFAVGMGFAMVLGPLGLSQLLSARSGYHGNHPLLILLLVLSMFGLLAALAMGHAVGKRNALRVDELVVDDVACPACGTGVVASTASLPPSGRVKLAYERSSAMLSSGRCNGCGAKWEF